MAGFVDGRVVVITGAGGGIGRAHALAFAAEGAKVVVNDLGGSRDGDGASAGPAQSVVEEIVAAGGTAVANTDDISSFDGAENLIRQAIETYGGIDTLVNNAGILRDRMLTNMSEAEWDAVIKVHLKGTFATTRFASEFWKAQSKEGREVNARVVNTTSPSGLFGNIGQTNYGAAKAGVAMFSTIAALELGRYGVNINAIAPTALTRMTEDLPGLASDDEKFTALLAPENISPLVVWLGSTDCQVSGRVFGVWGHKVSVAEGWTYGPYVDRDDRWTAADLGAVVPELVAKALPNADMYGDRPEGD